eukprot:CAMPEP_0115834168 /NCGR_PEP_ID=MMETSP0287-20121206/3546_1 /TAXON_ID=412157 /ORGANISM="Chrysochromulina rotalis, Strain UIO044" /LENGTH=368 /DNA_ID=CAMNT_0003287599 /DNA_START=23 /DNA_END=1129 /DNA_ORIENTATION=+
MSIASTRFWEEMAAGNGALPSGSAPFKMLTIGGQMVLQLAFRGCRPSLHSARATAPDLRYSHGIILGFDMNDQSTLQHLQQRLDGLDATSEHLAKLLIGRQVSVTGRRVADQEITAFAERNHLRHFVELSAAPQDEVGKLNLALVQLGRTILDSPEAIPFGIGNSAEEEGVSLLGTFGSWLGAQPRESCLAASDVDQASCVLSMEHGWGNCSLEYYREEAIATQAAGQLWCSWVLFRCDENTLDEISSGGSWLAHPTIRRVTPALHEPARIAMHEQSERRQAIALRELCEEQLRQDARVFRAARPESRFEDFIATLSPVDVCNGVLSPRMRGTDHHWRQAWDQAKPANPACLSPTTPYELHAPAAAPS